MRWPIAPLVIDHPMNRETFDIYVETQFAPSLQKGDVVILDSLPSHKSLRPSPSSSRAVPGSFSCCLNRPDLNPIEIAPVKLKAHLRRIGVRTIDAPWTPIGDFCALYSQQECFNFIKDVAHVFN